MAQDRAGMKSALWPLLLLWLAAHALLLGLILGAKFLTAKAVALLLLAGTAAWFLSGRRRTPSLFLPPGMV
jgi:hypothetical protein